MRADADFFCEPMKSRESEKMGVSYNSDAVNALKVLL